MCPKCGAEKILGMKQCGNCGELPPSDESDREIQDEDRERIEERWNKTLSTSHPPEPIEGGALEMQPPAESELGRVLAAAPGIVLLLSLGPALIYYSRLDGGSPNSLEWFMSVIWAVCAIALIGLIVYRCSSSVSESPGSIPWNALILASSIFLIAFEIVLLHPRMDESRAYMMMTILLVLGTITAIECRRFAGRVGYTARVIWIASIIPGYLLAIQFIWWWMISLRGGCS